MTPEEFSKMIRGLEQEHANDRAVIIAAAEGDRRSQGEAERVIKKYVMAAIHVAQDEYRREHRIPAHLPVTNEQVGLRITVGDIDNVVEKVRNAGWTRSSIRRQIRQLGAKSGGKLDTEQLLKRLGMLQEQGRTDLERARQERERTDPERARRERERTDPERARRERERTDPERARRERAFYRRFLVAFRRRPQVWTFATLSVLAGIGVGIAFLISLISSPYIGTGSNIELNSDCGIVFDGYAGSPDCSGLYEDDLYLSDTNPGIVPASLLAGESGAGIVVPLSSGTRASFQTCVSAVSTMLHKYGAGLTIGLLRIHPGETLCVLPPSKSCPPASNRCQDVLALVSVIYVITTPPGQSNPPASVTINFTAWSWNNGPPVA